MHLSWYGLGYICVYVSNYTGRMQLSKGRVKELHKTVVECTVNYVLAARFAEVYLEYCVSCSKVPFKGATS